jgi:hypothetical protein
MKRFPPPVCLSDSLARMIKRYPIMSQTAVVVLFVLAWVPTALSTQTYCAVVKPTSDGFVALRAGPGTTFSTVERLRPFDFVWMDTASCRGELCDESGQWQFVEGVPRLDGPLGNERTFTQGWIRSRYVKPIVCPAE